jgi:hypothetical protein
MHKEENPQYPLVGEMHSGGGAGDSTPGGELLATPNVADRRRIVMDVAGQQINSDRSSFSRLVRLV